MNKENSQSNPVNAGSSDDFFDAMDRSVNGAIIDEDQQVQDNPQDSGPFEATHNQTVGSNNNQVDWEKRYKDSSREATRIAAELKDLKPFVPLLKVMKQDSGLVDTVKNYLTNGGKPAKNIKEQLGLDEDFIFDQDDAFNDPGSDSAKLLNSHVDGLVNSRVSKMMTDERTKTQTAKLSALRNKEEQLFKQKHNMSDEEFNGMVQQAKSRRMTLDDVHYLMNKDTAKANIANSTKADMRNQMKNVRNIPTTASGVNSPRAEKSGDDQVFDDLVDSGGGMEELFG